MLGYWGEGHPKSGFKIGVLINSGGWSLSLPAHSTYDAMPQPFNER